MLKMDTVGADWLAEEINALTDCIERVTPVEFNEKHRYLPASVTSLPGYIRYSVFPFLEEIVDCFGVEGANASIREVNLKKGVQVGYTTALESVLLYFIAQIKTAPVMMVSADKELVDLRIENYILPMLQQSGLGDLIRSSDEGNSRKTGKNKNQLQWEGNGFLIPLGAQNANKMRSASIMVLLKDEIDAWPLTVGRDGDPDGLTDDRCSAYWDRRKIFRGSTPLLEGSSKIDAAYKRGDQRKYLVRCISCGYSQELRWSTENQENGIIGGMGWELENGVLVPESVHYACQNCGHQHFEHDKEQLFSKEHGARWEPTSTPVEPGIRSYHLPALYSPIGFQPWSKSVAAYLEGWDVESKRVKDISKYQVFYNNVLGEPFKVMGAKIRLESVSSHRRTEYKFGEVPNAYARLHSRSNILFLTCQIDVHKNNLAVAVMGWCRDSICYLVDYWRFEVQDGEPDCTELSSPVWQRARDLIEQKEYTADDGTTYRIAQTLIDAGYENDTITTFCSDYAGGVFPILGRDRAAKNQTIREFAEFKTQAGTIGYRILVDHYKDRTAQALRREWTPDSGPQSRHHFNAPVDITSKQLEELTKEVRREKTDERGNKFYLWYRPGNAANELWDLLNYGHASVEILAWNLCIQHFKLDNVDWAKFWEYAESKENAAVFGRSSQEVKVNIK